MSNSSHEPKIEITTNYQTPFIEYVPKPNYWIRRALAVGLVATAALGVAKGVNYVTTPRDQVVYSTETTTEVAQDETDTVWKYANTIKGVGSVVTTQEAVDYLEETNPGLEDGLDQGEAVEIPTSVEVVEPVDSKE